MTPTVVILLSDKRSGSTYLEREICGHPAVSHVDYTPHSYFETHYWIMAARLLERPAQYFSGGKMPKNYGSKAAARKLLLKLVQDNVPDFNPPDDDRALVFSGWESLCDRFANPVFFEKSPQHVHHWAALELMHEWFLNTRFQVKFIFLYRNPMAVMYSARELFHTEPSRRQYGWAEGIRNAIAFREIVGERHFYTLSYESLVADSPGMLAQLWEFMGVPAVDGGGEAVRADSVDRWREDPGFGLELDDAVRRMAHYLGYADSDLVSKYTGISGNRRSGGRIIDGAYRLKNRLYNLYRRFKQ